MAARSTLDIVVIFDYAALEHQLTGHGETDAADLVDQGCTKRI